MPLSFSALFLPTLGRWLSVYRSVTYGYLIIGCLVFLFSASIRADAPTATTTLPNINPPEDSPAAQPPPFRVLLFPFMYKTFTANWWKPIGLHIKADSGIATQVRVADNYESFLKTGADDHFDLFFIPDHMFNVFYNDYQRLPAAHITLASNNIIFITNANQPLHSFTELKGSCLSLPDPLSFTALHGLNYLAKQGFKPGTDFTAIHSISQSDVVLNVIRGDCPLGAMSEVLLRQTLTNNRNILVFHKVSVPKFFGVSFFINQHLSPKRKTLLTQALLSFGTTASSSELLKKPLYFRALPLEKPEIKRLIKAFSNDYPLLKSHLNPRD